jgi:hypothetical protein
MIKATFRLGGDLIEIIIRGNELLFFDINSGMISTIEGIKLSKSGCLKEFPDLIDDDEWRKKTMKRLKEKIKEYKSEMEKIYYIKDELTKHGYEPLSYQKGGFRAQRFHQ